METGRITGFHGSWGSGLAQLVLKDGNGRLVVVHCENVPTVRALDAAFPGFITDGHCVDVSAIAGRRIGYSVDGLGLLLGFDVLED